MSLKLLHTPIAEDGADISPLDIVAVHGFDEDEYEAWTYGPSGVNWLEAFLPSAVNGALQPRIFSYGYSADSASLLGNDAANGVLQQAHNLVARLQAERSLSHSSKRPIIFICHGLGGIIVKRALAFSATQVSKKVTHNYSIYISTFAILFFGTPHNGLESAFVQSVNGIQDDNDGLDLAMKRQHEVLQNVADLFAPLVKQFRIFFFWEQIKTEFKFDSSYIVREESAAPLIDDVERSGLYATHAEMCRFDGKSSPGYMIVLDALLRYSRIAQASISGRWQNAAKFLATQRSIEASELVGFNVHKDNEMFVYLNSPRIKSFEAKPLRNKYFHVPHNVSNMFTGQGRQYHELRQKMFKPKELDHGNHRRVFVLYGLGGSGKTQFCLKFIQDHRDNFWAVFWVDASSVETAERALSDIGRIGGLGENYQAGMYWLTGLDLPWMLVIDNADDPRIDYSRFFPAGDKGHILITSRLKDCRMHATVGFQEFRNMEEEDAITLLLRAADEDINLEKSRQTAKPIVQALGYLPLALTQAGASIRQNVCTLEGYLALYDTHCVDLMRGRLGQSTDSYPNSIYTTWEVTVRRIEEENSETAIDAVQILQILAFLHFEQVPIDLFETAWHNLHTGLEGLPPESIVSRVVEYLSSMPGFINRAKAVFPKWPVKRQRRLPLILLEPGTSWNSFRFRAALVMLEKHSLIYRDAGKEQMYSTHPMVHSWARERLNVSEQRLWSDVAMNTIASSITPYAGAEQQRYRIALIPHISACLKGKISSNIFNGVESNYQISKSIKFAMVYAEGGNWKEASRIQERVIQIQHAKRGIPCAGLLEVIIALADSYWNLDRLAESHQLLSEAVRLSTANLGKDNPMTLRAMDKLAGASWLFGVVDKAKALSIEAVGGLRRVLEPNHLYTLDAMDTLGRTLMHLDLAREANTLHQEVLDGRKRKLGPSHPDTLMAMANLAMSYYALKDLDRAEELLDIVYLERANILGEEHAYTLWAINDLSKIRCDQGRPVEAERMLTGILDTVVRTLGKEHIGMLMTKYNLARAYGAQERWAESERVLLELTEIHKKKVPAEHPDSITVKLELAKVTKHLGQLDDAEQMLRELTELAGNVLGSHHTKTKDAMGQLAAIYIAKGQLEEADKIEAELRQRLLLSASTLT